MNLKEQRLNFKQIFILIPIEIKLHYLILLLIFQFTDLRDHKFIQGKFA